jgi:hypothetical protein
MKFVKNVVISLALAATVAAPAFATVVQTLPPAGASSYGGWNQVEIGRLTLAGGTNILTALTAYGTTWDQGWGGQDPWSNQVGVALYDNGNQVVWQRVGGAVHQVTSFNYTATAAELANFNTFLGAMDPNATHSLTMKMMLAPLGYGGWQLFANNSSFTVESGSVPEPGSIALLGLALAGFAAARRKMSK